MDWFVILRQSAKQFQGGISMQSFQYVGQVEQGEPDNRRTV